MPWHTSQSGYPVFPGRINRQNKIWILAEEKVLIRAKLMQ
jgi:hypothetical protein